MQKTLQTGGFSGKMTVKDGWVLCPVCGKGKLLKVTEGTIVRKLFCKCKLCGRISEVNITAPEPVSEETSA